MYSVKQVFFLYNSAGHTGDLSSKRVHQTPRHFRLNTTTICILMIFQEGVYIFIIFPGAHEYIQIVLYAGVLQLLVGLWWSFVVTSCLSVVFLICPLATFGVLCILIHSISLQNCKAGFCWFLVSAPALITVLSLLSLLIYKDSLQVPHSCFVKTKTRKYH